MSRRLDVPRDGVHTGEKCWPYDGYTSKQGYGTKSSKRNGKTVTISIHRTAYEIMVGPIPSGLEIDHLCRVRHCYNPRHLELVTHAENQRRMAAARATCPAGHPWTEANTYTYQRAAGISRTCRLCHRNAERRRRAQHPKERQAA